MRKNHISICGIVLCVSVLLLAACTKMDHYYKDYVIERTYIGKPDSIWIEPGDQRVRIGMLTPKDADAKELIVRWGESDSVVLAIDPGIEQQNTIIENLEEGNYLFNAYTSDRLGNRSLTMELSTTVYGDSYRNTLHDRSLSHSVVFPDSIALVFNTLQSETLIGTEVEFTDKAGEEQRMLLPSSEALGIIVGADRSKTISLRTVYSPDVNAFEYFYTEPIVLDLEETKRSSLTFTSDGYLDAAYVDFKFVRTFLEQDVPAPMGQDIDMCYALGAGSRGNLFAMDGTGFSAFASTWQAAIDFWPVQNVARLKLDRSEDAVALFEELDEMDRDQMMAAYEGSAGAELTRLSGLAVGDVIFLHVADRAIYVAIKVLATPPAISGALGDLVIEFKVSRP